MRYWRMISCLHSSDPVSNEGEMRAGPIWNNRIPFAIVFLSVSLFLGSTMDTNAYRLPACVCVRGYKRACSQYVDGETERERYRDKRAHTFVLVMRYTYGNRAIMLSAYRHRTPGTLCDPRIRIPSTCIMLLLRFLWKASTGTARRQRVVKEIPRFVGTNVPHRCRWYRDASFDECTA